VRWYCAGPHGHDVAQGSRLATKMLNVVRAGDVTYNKMWVRKGAFGVVPTELDGWFATSEYPTFEVDTAKASSEFLRHMMGLGSFQDDASARCKGTTSRARLNP